MQGAYTPTCRHPSKADWKETKEIITSQRLSWGIDSFQPFKSQGEDGIFYGPSKEGKREDPNARGGNRKKKFGLGIHIKSLAKSKSILHTQNREIY
ncbi:hypothetical protein, partial [Klebsiella pneumoniae]|uniref:hypothetical protein n=1 Tax=Klebsiella pneumoniae TaxID=573 RepID=UPI001C8F9139